MDMCLIPALGVNFLKQEVKADHGVSSLNTQYLKCSNEIVEFSVLTLNSLCIQSEVNTCTSYWQLNSNYSRFSIYSKSKTSLTKYQEGWSTKGGPSAYKRRFVGSISS